MDVTEVMDAFRKVLDVEPVETNFFRGLPQPGARGRTFGGQVIAQALMSAIKTVEDDKPAHSLHAYFMRPGEATAPVLYQVERDRDGRSFATRRVVAVQNGQPILNLAASFHHVEPGWSHASPMPDVPPPEDLPDETALGEAMADQLRPAVLDFLRRPKPIEMRPVHARPPFDRSPRPAVQSCWFRVRGQLPDDPKLHRVALAFASDYALMGTAMVPHSKAFDDPDIMTASLDHALWLHDDFRADDWLFYDMDSPWAGGGRGLNRGRIFTRDGRLVANAAQEGLMRPVTPRG